MGMRGVNMTAKEIASFVGQRGTLPVAGNEMSIEVEVLDADVRYGRVDFLVTPLFGTGRKWVQADRVELQEREEF